MTQRTYIRAFVGNQIRPDKTKTYEFIAEGEISKISLATVTDAQFEQLDGYRLDLTNGQVLYTLALRTFTIQEVEAEVERALRLGQEAESPIT